MRAAILLSLAILSGCATAPSPQFQEYKNYVAINRPLAQQGSIPWSQYYRGVFDRASAAGVSGQVLSEMNNAIRDAEQFEAGAITKQEFEYRSRATRAESLAAAQREAAQASAQQSANGAALMTTGLQLMQASAPHTLAQPVAASPSPIIGFLQTQSVNGFLRYCRYSNGVVTTIASTALCPMNTQ